MVIVMEMSTGRTRDEKLDSYDDEVLNAGWTEVPRIGIQLQVVGMPSRGELARVDVEGFMARLYVFQE